jgi:hypothetical protein
LGQCYSKPGWRGAPVWRNELASGARTSHPAQRSGESRSNFTFFIDNQHCVAIYVVQHHCFAMRGRPIGGLDGYETKDCEEAGEKGCGQSGEADPEAQDRETRQEEREKGCKKSTWESEG